MTRNIGNQRVLDALADTVAPLSPVDLAPHGPPECDPHAASRYVEGAELGRGGLGVVVEAFDQDLRSTVALKRPRSDVMGERAVVELVREAQITAQLDHPNIPAVHALGIDSVGRPFFTMTRLRGRALSQILSERRTDPDTAGEFSTPRLLRIFLQVGFAVAFAHSRGVLHRDLKPQNIIVGEFGEVRLVDWGIAKVIADADAEDDRPALSTSAPHEGTQVGAFVGTPGYAAPEQVRGQADIDGRADVYALGALLYEMLTGRPPVTGPTMAAVVAGTLEGSIPPVHTLVHLDERLAAVVHKALELERGARYADVLAMLADVEALIEGRPVSALHEGAIKRVGRWYLGRSLRVARLKTVHIDCLAWACFVLGASTGMYMMTLDLPWPDLWAWALLVFGILAFIPVAYTLARKPRPEDPGVLHAFTGAPSTRPHHDTLGTAPTVPREPPGE
ncbi:MAG: serine/threonine protein kinase [Deltaproteobacteria bacterium]|nr:serine/threonine protein kinase [Deltaproteobacteria bacterium]